MSKIISVMFIHESGLVENYRVDEIRANPEAFKAILAEHKAAGRHPLAMRQTEAA